MGLHSIIRVTESASYTIVAFSLSWRAQEDCGTLWRKLCLSSDLESYSWLHSATHWHGIFRNSGELQEISGRTCGPSCTWCSRVMMQLCSTWEPCYSPLWRTGGQIVCCYWWILLANPPSSLATVSKWTRITRWIPLSCAMQWRLSSSTGYASLGPW